MSAAIKELFKPTAAKLAEHVAELEGELARLAAAQDQAEAAAVTASADPVAYAKAAEAADRIKGEIATQTARLQRLQRAYAETAEKEQTAYIERLGVARDEARAALQVAVTEAADARRQEEARHAKAMADITDRENGARGALSNAEHTLQEAQAGLTEEDHRRIGELREQFAKVQSDYGGQALHDEATQAHSVWLSAEHRYNESEALAAKGYARKDRGLVSSEREKARAESERLQGRLREMNARLRVLTDQIQAIRGKIDKR